MKEYIQRVASEMRIKEETPDAEQALDCLLYHLATSIDDKNKYKLLLLKELFRAIPNQICSMIDCLIYCPGGCLFTDPSENVGVVLERGLITEELRILLEFIQRNIDEFKEELITFLHDCDLCDEHKKSMHNFWSGLCEYLDASPLQRFTQEALALSELGRPIPAMPDEIRGEEKDFNTLDDFIKLLELKAQEYPEFVPILSAWINVIPADEYEQSNALKGILGYIGDVEGTKFALLDPDLFSFRHGAINSIETIGLLRTIRKDLDTSKFQEKFAELVQNILAMPLCAERRAAITNLLQKINQNPL